MFRVRLLIFVAVTALVTACSTSLTSPESPRRLSPRAVHDGQPADTTDSSGTRGWINPNG